MKYIIFLLQLLPVYKTSISQTAIVVAMKKDSLIVGTDSRVGRGNNLPPDTLCKIKKYKKFYYTFTGNLFEKSFDSIERYFRGATNISEASSMLLKNRLQWLTVILNFDWLNHKEDYIQNFQYNKYNEFELFGIENNQIVVREVCLLVKSLPIDKPVIDTLNIVLSRSIAARWQIHTAGEKDSMNANLSNHEIWRQGSVIAVEKLIEIQSRATPERVGLPLDIIVLTTKGKVVWPCPTGLCYPYHKKKKDDTKKRHQPT